MTGIDAVKKILEKVPDISLGYSEINFLRSDELEEGQEGYSFDSSGKSLITGKDGDWEEGWVVIASDNVGDPIFVDTAVSFLPVFSAIHGQGTWDPFIIADSLDRFIDVISILARVSENRTYPVDIENNPIDNHERKAVIKEIRKLIPHSEVEYWEAFLDN